MDTRTVTPKELGLPDRIPLPTRTDWRIGLVGFGGIAGAHAPAYAEAGWKIVAVADPDPAALERARTTLGDVAIYDDFEALVADGQVEVVSLLTQPTLREAVVAAAAGAGKPILTEKPFATTLEECERMAAVASDAGVRLAVSQNYRWYPANFFAKHIIDKGLIGGPFHLAIEIFGTQDVGLANHPFYSKATDFLTVQWNNHLADLLRYWTGRDAVRVFTCSRRMKGQNFTSDNLLMSIADFGEGVTGQITHSELLRSGLGKSGCRVDGDEGSIQFDLYGGGLTFQSRQLGDVLLKLDVPDWMPSMCGTMGDLLLSIEEDREPLVSARRNLGTMRHVMADQASAAAGGIWVEP